MTLDCTTYAPVQGPLLMSPAHRGVLVSWGGVPERIMYHLQGPLLMSEAHRGTLCCLLCVRQSESCSRVMVRY